MLGKTGIRVSRLCFGSLTIGPLQANLPVEEGAGLIASALELGVNFIDTADLYGTYPHIRRAIAGRREKPVIASKSYAYTRQGMRECLERALLEMDLPAIDIFLLHEQESAQTLAGHRDALEYLLEAKTEGKVRAVGFSTHTIAAVKAAAEMPEIEVIHPLVNSAGVGIRDGSVQEMLEALAVLHERGVGIYSMKPLGGGHLIGRNSQALEFVLAVPFLDSVAVGMGAEDEIRYNAALFANTITPPGTAESLRLKKRRLLVHDWCSGCGMCLNHCPQSALRLRQDKTAVDQEVCILCGYCGAHCPNFCLKII